MISKLEFKVQYSDTDAYKVAWHGAYLRWMEAGRVDLLYMMGVDIKELEEKQDIILPVVELDIKYKRSAKLFDNVVVKTEIVQLTDLCVSFEQTVLNKETNEILTLAKVKGVCVKNGKITRNLKTVLKG